MYEHENTRFFSASPIVLVVDEKTRPISTRVCCWPPRACKSRQYVYIFLYIFFSVLSAAYVMKRRQRIRENLGHAGFVIGQHRFTFIMHASQSGQRNPLASTRDFESEHVLLRPSYNRVYRRAGRTILVRATTSAKITGECSRDRVHNSNNNDDDACRRTRKIEHGGETSDRRGPRKNAHARFPFCGARGRPRRQRRQTREVSKP